MAQSKTPTQYFQGTGRRKESVARVRLHLCTKGNSLQIGGKKYEKGNIVVNNKDYGDIFARMVDRKRIVSPFQLTDSVDRFITTISVEGGGTKGQIDAIIHGIARALVNAEGETYKSILRESGILTRDPRERERRKAGTGGKARKQKQSPKR